MIIDKIANLKKYLSAGVYQRLIGVLSKIDADTPEGTYEIDGDMFIKVMSYDLHEKEECKIEAHNEFIDIQSTIVGVEGIGIFDRNELVTSVPYSSEKDVLFFFREEAKLKNNLAIYPNEFILLFPEEAHSPKQRALSHIQHVKKFVIKLRTKLFGDK